MKKEDSKKELIKNINGILTANGLPVIAPSDIPSDYTKVDNQIIKDIGSHIGLVGLGLFLCLCSKINPITKIAEISTSELSKEMKTSKETIIKYLKQLESLNQIIIIEKGKSHSKTKIYITAFPKDKYSSLYDRIIFKETTTTTTIEKEIIIENNFNNSNMIELRSEVLPNSVGSTTVNEKVRSEVLPNSVVYTTVNNSQFITETEVTDPLITFNNKYNNNNNNKNVVVALSDFKKNKMQDLLSDNNKSKSIVEKLINDNGIENVYDVIEYVTCYNKDTLNPKPINNVIGFMIKYFKNPDEYDISKYSGKIYNNYLKKIEKEKVNEEQKQKQNDEEAKRNKLNSENKSIIPNYYKLEKVIQEKLIEEFKTTNQFKIAGKQLEGDLYNALFNDFLKSKKI